MNKMLKIVQICLLTILLMLLTGILFWGLNKNASFSMFDTAKEVKKETVTLENIDEIIFNFKSSDVKIYPSDINELKIVKYARKKEKNLFNVKKNQNTLTVEDKSDDFCIGFCFNNSARYEIYLPKTYKGNLNVNEVSGDIELKAEKLNNIKLKTISGDIDIISLSANSLISNTKSGEINIGNITSNNADIRAVSGDIDIKNLILNHVKINSISGDISINKLKGKIEFSTTSGDIYINDFKITEASKISSVSGDVEVNLNKSSNCNVILESISGDKNLPNNSSLVGNGKYKFQIKTTSGDIDVNI